MKVTLDRIDTRGLTVGFPGSTGDTVAIGSTTNLRGTLVVEGDVTSIRDARADAIVLSKLHLTLGSLTLAAPDGATLKNVTLGGELKGDSTRLEVGASSLEAPEVSILVDDVAVKGRAALEGVRLVVRGDVGSLSAAKVDLAAFTLRIDDVDVGTESLRGSAVEIGWGDPSGFRLDAGTLRAPALGVELPKTKVALDGVDVTAVSLRGDDVAVGHVAIETSRVALDLSDDAPSAAAPAAAPTAPASESAATEPFIDFRVLDGLNGRIDVDVSVDLTVPIIGRRHATHELRVPIDHGSIDYRELERNLSALEDAILDFSVRDGALVLERVNPLLPIRGHGKPIVAWSLTGDDLALAERDRVRLAVLPEAALVKDDEPSDEPPSESPVSLQLLRLMNLQARGSLAPPTSAVAGRVRPTRIGALAVEGHVQYDPNASALPGALRAELSDAAASIHQLAVDDTTTLDVAELSIGGIAPLEITFADVTPTAIRLEASRVAAGTVSVKTR